MKFTRKANTNWKGTGMEGKGTVSTQSTALHNTQLSFKTRFEDGSIGTNPEELIAAAHSGCYTMQLSFLLSEAGYVPENLDTEARLTFEDGTITKIQRGDVMARVTIDTGNGATIVSSITVDSVDRLKLDVGSAVVALIKATEVMVAIP